ncbi:putative DUF1015 family protein [Monocercomonoides exilis]|uniref:putative DUF1015 family protein n=1 Tax=Monocercomonoides exilis TaxID=2049356 RepID=UPI00355A810D|nr:putative DUF1015 family protein [Monocercomonoides exilis]|eukprot:MONOS_14109.1-p1 / transcript=MONOS_14109.1 / gene=MONOS_14109 / organism=Monocercomonoides_exilis_PA203 / gene_product=putative uncharacterized protein / transcript_product=putative uncharacterized protein / location=Mono_scaffold00940:4778-6202(-) / protein_length=453 / sequence_SO=supercontig / SO=protein_coding / is_pseudo=false
MAEKVFMQVPKLLLPKPEFRKHWPVVACDQFTSEPQYWEAVKKEVGSDPSMLHLILPELYLESPEEEGMIQDIIKSMQEYMDKGIFEELQTCVYLERRTRKTPCRRGVIMALDLEAYDFHSDSHPSPIRPTEMTVVERIPPRLRVRSKALIESPHILVLVDDPERKIIEPLTEEKEKMEKLYDQELMLGAGHICGYRIPPESVDRIVQQLNKLFDPKVFEEKYKVAPGTPTLLYAVGDGNHSLATAKQSWENIKSACPPEKLDELMKTHPARFCMIELSNIYDEGIEFEPIHRVLFGVKERLIDALQKKFGAEAVLTTQCESLAKLKEAVEHPPSTIPKDKHSFGLIEGEKFYLVSIPAGNQTLPVGAIQTFLDSPEYKPQYSKIDYIHGDDVVISLIRQDIEHNIGIILPVMSKDSLFPTVIKNARLPRKTFSMGEADEKRFYFECRKIVP